MITRGAMIDFEGFGTVVGGSHKSIGFVWECLPNPSPGRQLAGIRNTLFIEIRMFAWVQWRANEQN